MCGDKIIRKVYPDARIYQIVGDGRDVVRSWLNRRRYFPAGAGLQPLKDALLVSFPLVATLVIDVNGVI